MCGEARGKGRDGGGGGGGEHVTCSEILGENCVAVIDTNCPVTVVIITCDEGGDRGWGGKT